MIRIMQLLHSGDANRSITSCQRVDLLSNYESRLHDGDLTRIVLLRQGLWIEDLRIPPGQECSNGSLILLAVVLWRTFFCRVRSPGAPDGPASHPYHL